MPSIALEHESTGRHRTLLVTVMILAAAGSMSAQDRDRGSFLSDVAKKVILDPTTYAPAVVVWTATRLDWQSSQVFFQHGWSENNPRFTVSGGSDDTPISYGAGNCQIASDSIALLEFSLINNVSTRVTERLLVRPYPNHRKLLRAVGWVERSVVASYWSRRLSAGHLGMWRRNIRTAHRLGY
jgi:hypothetical protein